VLPTIDQPLTRARATDEQATPELSVVVPTFNEAPNIPLVVARLTQVLSGIRWEVIFVDDNSPDGTTGVARDLACSNAQVRCIRRIGRRGLAGACIEGLLASSASAIAVMDADLQHNETLLPRMLDDIRGGADLSIGTRFAEGASIETGLSHLRQWSSRLATETAKRVLGVRLSDPMSGFFMMRRSQFDAIAPKLSTQGFKLLLDIVASSPSSLKIVERPFEFRPRLHGQSKLDSLVVLEFLGLILAKLSGDWLSIRFLLFALFVTTVLFVYIWLL